MEKIPYYAPFYREKCFILHLFIGKIWVYMHLFISAHARYATFNKKPQKTTKIAMLCLAVCEFSPLIHVKMGNVSMTYVMTRYSKLSIKLNIKYLNRRASHPLFMITRKKKNLYCVFIEHNLLAPFRLCKI
jgi:hypothetical protein